jgi:hypothetical protein
MNACCASLNFEAFGLLQRSQPPKISVENLTPHHPVLRVENRVDKDLDLKSQMGIA